MDSPARMGATPDLRATFAVGDSNPADAVAAYEARIEWLRGLAVWIAAGSGGSRLSELTAHVRANPDAAQRLRETVRSVVAESDALRLFTEAGFPARTSLPAEALVRVVRFFVPRAGDGGDLLDVVRRLTTAEGDGTLLAAHSPAQIGAFLDATGLTEHCGFGRLFVHLAEAVAIHCTRCAAIGLDADVRRAVGRGALACSPFHRLAGAGTRLFEAVARTPADPAAAAVARLELEEALASARAARDKAYAHLETAGVSTDMVLRLDILGRTLDRIELALPVLAPRADERAAAAVAHLMAGIAAGVRREASFLQAVADRTRLMAKTVVERCGTTGSHYITLGRADWWQMARTGAGGGLIVGLVVWAKVAIYAMHPPPGVLALLSFVNYAAGFLLIYSLHLTLATKQPPMTAAALADALARGGEGRDMEPVVTMVQRICRSQIAGLIGNVVAAVAMSALLDMAVLLATGHRILTAEEAVHTLEDHHPLLSFSILFAIVTGTAVWMSSMVAGWAENAAHYGRLTESLDHARGGRLTAWLVRNIGGVAGNVSLALFLVLISFGGKVTGIPWDVRHVTVSTGQVTMALAAAPGLTAERFAWSVAGVAVVGFLNITTGFFLSFRIALRARGVAASAWMRLLPPLAASALRHPLRFVLPVDDDASPAPAAAH